MLHSVCGPRTRLTSVKDYRLPRVHNQGDQALSAVTQIISVPKKRAIALNSHKSTANRLAIIIFPVLQKYILVLIMF